MADVVLHRRASSIAFDVVLLFKLFDPFRVARHSVTQWGDRLKLTI